MLELIVTVVIGAAKWLIYTGLIWLMIKVQKLNYNWLGLFASTLAGTALSYIPFVGPFIAWAVLIVCLWKCTGADIAPDIFFTVSIAGALMFCVNLFVIGALMGDIGPKLGLVAYADSGDYEDDEVMDGDSSEDSEDSESESDADETKQEPVVNFLAPATTAQSTSAAPVRVHVTRDYSKATFKDPQSLPTRLGLKGVSLNSTQKVAMISAGRSIHAVAEGDTFNVASPRGMMKLVCEDISQTAVILGIDQGDKIRLTFQ